MGLFTLASYFRMFDVVVHTELERVPNDFVLDNDDDMASAPAFWTRRPRRRSLATFPNSAPNDDIDDDDDDDYVWTQDYHRDWYPTNTSPARQVRQRRQRQRRSSISHASPHKDSNRYYFDQNNNGMNYDFDQDDVYHACSDPPLLGRRKSLQHYHRHHDVSSYWSPVTGLSQHQDSVLHPPAPSIAPPSSFYPGGQVSLPSTQPLLLPMPQPMIPTVPPFLPPMGFPNGPSFQPMMMMPRPFFPDAKTMPPAPAPATTAAPAPSTPDQTKSPQSAPTEPATKAIENSLLPLARSLSLGTHRRRSLFGSLFHHQPDPPATTTTLIPVQDLTSRSLTRKQSLSLEKKAKALSQRRSIWCYRIKPSLLSPASTGCWVAMTNKNQIKLDPYLGHYQPNTAAVENLPTLVTLDKEPKLTGSITAMPQAKIARVYPSLFSSSTYIELVLDCLPADSQFVVRSE